MRYIPCNCDMFILANSNSVMDTTFIHSSAVQNFENSCGLQQLNPALVHALCARRVHCSRRIFAHASTIHRKAKGKKDVWYWQISPILIYFACIISSCHDISSSHCSQLQRDAIFHACMIHDAPTQTNRKYRSICQIRLLIDQTSQINLAWHTVRVEDNGTWKIFQVIQVDDSISIRFFYTTLAVKVY